MNEELNGRKMGRRAKNIKKYSTVTARSIRRNEKYQKVYVTDYDAALKNNIAVIRLGRQY